MIIFVWFQLESERHSQARALLGHNSCLWYPYVLIALADNRWPNGFAAPTAQFKGLKFKSRPRLNCFQQFFFINSHLSFQISWFIPNFIDSIFFLLSSISNPKVSSVSTSCNPRGFEIGARLEVIELLAPISNDSIRSWFGNLDLERWGGGRRRGRMGGGRGWFNYWAQRKCSFEMNFLKFACLFDLLLFLCFVFIHFFVFCFFFGFFVLFFTFLLWARNPHDTSGTVASGFH